MKNVITIGREYGSGGQEIAQRLAEELGFEFYNKDLISKVAEKLMVTADFIESTEERPVKRNIFQEFFPIWSNDATDNEKYIFEEQGKFIRQIAEDGNCIIAGRRADYYLKDNPNALHLFFYAEESFKVDRIMKKYGLTAEEAAKKCADMDKKRKSSYEYTTGRKWGDRHNYDRMIDTSTYGIDAVVKELAALIREENK